MKCKIQLTNDVAIDGDVRVLKAPVGKKDFVWRWVVNFETSLGFKVTKRNTIELKTEARAYEDAKKHGVIFLSE